MTEREFLAFLRASIENQDREPEIITSLAQPSAYWASDAKFAHVRRAALEAQDAEAVADDAAPRSIGQILKGVDSVETAQRVILDGLKVKLCSLLMIQEQDLDPSKAVVTYGLDSLVAVDFRNWIAKETGVRLQLMELLTRKSFIEVAAMITARSSLVDRKMPSS